MRRNILIILKHRFVLRILFFLLSQSFLFAQGLEIKSLRAYSSLDQTEFPIIDYSDAERNSITIEFDVQSKFIPNLRILFRFCDSNWKPYDSPFLLNPLYDTEYNIFFERLPASVKGAQYHYSGKFPNNNVRFPFSGKWQYFIVDSQNKNNVYGLGKFFVVHPEVNLTVQVLKERLEGEMPELSALGRTIALRTNFTLPDTLFPANVKKVEIITNRKIDFPIIIDRIQLKLDRYYEWNASHKFTFVARNIKPGNEYRKTDIRDVGKYNTPIVTAKFGEIETSNLFTRGRKDFNGASYLIDFRNEYADYMNVVFRIRPPEEIKAPIFLVGSFTNWKVLLGYEMFDDNGMMNSSVELKRGIHEYQYVTGNIVGNEVKNIDWEILEGNFWETENEYFVFLFYETVDKGGYDKIIGFKKIKTGGL